MYDCLSVVSVLWYCYSWCENKVHIYYPNVRRLGSLLKSDLVDDFVRSLELLSSPELIFKVGLRSCL